MVLISLPYPSWANDVGEWTEFRDHMQALRAANPYPAQLYRYVVSSTDVDVTARPTGSGLYESTVPHKPIGRGKTDGSVTGFFHQLGLQLGKYQYGRKAGDGGRDKDASAQSHLVSLSGDFRWTVQKACKIRRASSRRLFTGVAVFHTLLSKDADCLLFRVSDLLDYFDNECTGNWKHRGAETKTLRSLFSRDIRYWASNADEYVVWSHIPRVALVSFVSCDKLAPPNELNFLTKNFRKARDLSVVRKTHRVTTSNKKYWNLVSNFLGLFVEGMRKGLMLSNPHQLRLDLLVDTMVCPRQWTFDCRPRSGRVPPDYSPDVEWLQDAVVTDADLGHQWRNKMGAVEDVVVRVILDAVEQMKILQKGSHAKKCRRCKYEKWG